MSSNHTVARRTLQILGWLFLLFGLIAAVIDAVQVFVPPIPMFIFSGLAFFLSSPKLRSNIYSAIKRISALTRRLWLDPIWRKLLIAVAGFELVNFLALGLPGALLLQGHLTLLGWLGIPIAMPSGDNAWPAALLCGMLWPIGIWIAYSLVKQRWLALIAMVVAWGFAISALLALTSF
jgi:hypothetical protein